MKLITEVANLRALVESWRCQNLSIAFVPTMGNLHQGHLSLIDLAKQHADRVIASVFVNPLQFGEGEDFDRYPRTLDDDRAKLASHDCDALFSPSVQAVYPDGSITTRVQASPALSNKLEGAARPGHFDGVCTVVAKLFNLVQPDIAIFGQKDYQQWRVIQTMVADLNWPIRLIKAPIGRDADGLALSSRNQYLTAQQRQIAPKLYVCLSDIAQALMSGNRNFERLSQTACDRLLAEGFDQVDYISIVNASSLEPAQTTDRKLVILATARLGSTRLLDNIELTLEDV